MRVLPAISQFLPQQQQASQQPLATKKGSLKPPTLIVPHVKLNLNPLNMFNSNQQAYQTERQTIDN